MHPTGVGVTATMLVQASGPRNGRGGGDTTSWNGQGCGTALEASPVVGDYNR